MDIQIDIQDTEDANLFLRALWAQFRKTCGKCGWQYMPYRDGKNNTIYIGSMDINRPEGSVDIHITYKKKGTISALRFNQVLDRLIDKKSDLGKLIGSIVDTAKGSMKSPNRRFLTTSIRGLKYTPWKYQSDHFRIAPVSDRCFELTTSVDAFDAIDGKSEAKIKYHRLLDILSVETNSAFWLSQSDHENLSADKNVDRPEEFVPDQDWIDDYPIIEGRILISSHGKKLMDLISGLNSLPEDIRTFVRACNHFHTARKYEAQISDYLTVGELKPTEDANTYHATISVADNQLEIAGQLGAAHAEITGTVYMSALEVTSLIGAAKPDSCSQCGQPRFKISERVVELLAKFGGPHLAKIGKDYYTQRSKYLHEGLLLSDLSYTDSSIPLLEPTNPTGCRAQLAVPSKNLREYVGYCMRAVLKTLVK